MASGKQAETPLVVPTKELTPLVKEWHNTGNRLRVLAEKAGVSEPTIYDIWHGRTQFTTEHVADALLSALGANHVQLTYCRRIVKVTPV